MKYRTAELNVPAVVKAQIDMTAATPSLTTFGEVTQTLDIFRGGLEMAAVTSRPGSSQTMMGSEKRQSDMLITVLPLWRKTPHRRSLMGASVRSHENAGFVSRSVGRE